MGKEYQGTLDLGDSQEVRVPDQDVIKSILKPYGMSPTGCSIVGKAQFNLCTDNTIMGDCIPGDLFCRFSMHPNFRGKFKTMVLNGVPVECQMLNDSQLAVINAAMKHYQVVAEFAYVARDCLYVRVKFDKPKQHIAAVLYKASAVDNETVNGVRKALYDEVVKDHPTELSKLSFTKLGDNGKGYVPKV